MYGIVNKALEEMVCSQYGPQIWENILRQADLNDEIFLSHNCYPDEITYRLVGATCAITGREAAPLLEDFGRHWVLETGRRSYGGLLEAGGRNLSDFLLSLPNFHARVRLIYPQLNPPEFNCEVIGPGQIKVRYFSTRPGLAHFVIGLLDGLGTLFATKVSVEQIKVRERQDDYDEFLVQW
ncbi:heme NO-binding domain-containing protein [uncultured Deefgea sp.]|uniref:heme NO-binding domain-containing protein n=1 Tax=uncultured Deefgea sp. TaxID=1304914 RepID=UPI00262F219D|nr:heme NO-binding domain-containing protein [uncultured Deefgea sp.]